MRGTIDDILKQKYDEVKVPEGLINFRELVENVEMPGAKKRKKKKRIIITSLILAILLCGATILGIILTTDKPEEIVPSSYVAEINVINKQFGLDENPKGDCIYTIRIEKIIEYSMYDLDYLMYPITKVKAEVISNILGEEKENIEFWIPGGVCSIKDLKESKMEYDNMYINGFDDDDNVMVNYYENIRIDKPLEKQAYVITLNKLEDGLYVNKNLELGFKRYNEETNQFLNNDGEWVELDLNKYLE